MPLPRFDFELHEWPPLPEGYNLREGLASALFRVDWNGEEVEAVARWIKTSGSLLLFFRLLEEAQTTWLVSSHRYTPALFSFMVGHTPESRANSAEQRVKEAIKTSDFGHACNFDCSAFGLSGSRWVYLSADGRGGCWNGPGSMQEAAIFRLQQNSFEQEMDNAESNVRFALRWSQFSKDERICRALRFQNGGLDELRTVVRAVGIAEATHQNLTGSWTVAFKDEVAFRTNEVTALSAASINARKRRWSHHLNSYFAPHKDEVLAARYLCVELFRSPQYALFEEGPPTQHERLEAALFLRDWARDKIPPDELRLLLPKL